MVEENYFDKNLAYVRDGSRAFNSNNFVCGIIWLSGKKLRHIKTGNEVQKKNVKKLICTNV